MYSTKGFLSGEYRLLLAVLLILVVAGTVIFSQPSYSGYAAAAAGAPVGCSNPFFVQAVGQIHYIKGVPYSVYVNTSARSGGGIQKIVSYFKNSTDGKVWQQACNFPGPRSAVCVLDLGGAHPDKKTVNSYWGEAWDNAGKHAIDPCKGTKPLKWP